MSKHKIMNDVLGIIMAGGEGNRLAPLTNHRAKPAVPIFGAYRIYDFVATNMIHSNIKKIALIVQFKFDSLGKWHEEHYKEFNNLKTGDFFSLAPSQMRRHRRFIEGTAESIYENQNIIEDSKPKYVAVFAGDHVHYINIEDKIEYHIEKEADVTISAKPMKKKDIPLEKDGRLSFGVIDVDLEGRVTGFKEKPFPNQVQDDLWISMGNYIFTTPELLFYVNQEMKDFGKNVLPKMVKDRKKVVIYDYSKNTVPGMEKDYEKNFWMDLGTIDAYYEANMEALDIQPRINIYNEEWALIPQPPPTKTVFYDGVRNIIETYEKSEDWQRIGGTFQSLICGGCIISGAVTLKSIISKNVKLHSYAKVLDSVLFENVDVGRRAVIKNTIVDKNIRIPEGVIVGENVDYDISRGIPVSPKGVRVIWKGYDFSYPKGYDPLKFAESEDFETTGRLISLKPTYKDLVNQY